MGAAIDEKKPLRTEEEQVSFVCTEQSEGIGWITLNRPDTLNLLTSPMLAALNEALVRLGEDPAVRVIVLKAEGRGFCAGHDLKEVASGQQENLNSLFDRCTAMMEKIRLNPRPVIAQVQGLAVAAGCQLVASCDLVMACETAVFGTTGIKAGLFCATPMVPLSRVVPTRKALEMLLTGETLTAHEAERAGLVNHVVPPAQLAAKTLALARNIARHSAHALQLGKAAFYRQLETEMEQAYALGKQTIITNALAPDGQEGMRAFLEKRKPHYQHTP